MKKVTFIMALAVGAGLASCTAQSPKANLKTDVDSLSYAIGMARTEGLTQYLMQQGVDTTQMAEFIKGFNEGAAKTSKKDVAYMTGMQIGQMVGKQWVEGFNQQIFGGDSTQTISRENLLAGFIAGITDKSNVMTKEAATAYMRDGMEAIKEKALRATMKMSGQSDEEIDKAIEESKEQLSGNAEYTALMEAAANLSSMTEEQLMEELTQADTTAFMTMMNEILSGAEMAEVTEQPGDCDAAKSYVKVTVPPEKIAEMTKALLEMIHSAPSIGAYMDAFFSAADTSWDDLLKELDEADLYADDIVYEYWTAEAGELVRMTASAKINNGGEEPLPISFTMTRNTADGVATWLVTIKSAEDTAATLTFAGDLENFTANLTAYAGEDPVEINVSGKGVGTDSSVVDVEIKETVDGVEQGFGVVVTTFATMDGEQGVRKVDVLVRFMGLDVVTITAETRTCDAKDALDVSKAQDLGAMTDSEFQTWFVKVMNNLQNLPMTLLMSLPESMLTLLMGGSN